MGISSRSATAAWRRTVTDPLGRLINFNYDEFNHLLSITQNWAGQTHTWATFAYGTQTIQTNFQGLTLNGTANGAQESVLLRVGLADGSVYSFEYNTYAQVKTIRRYAPNNSNPASFPDDYLQRAYTTYGLPDNANASQSDCPRITSRTDWAYDWTQATYTYLPDSSFATGQVTFPDGTRYKEFFATTGWQRGLTTLTENWSGDVRKKWTELQWTQDNTGVVYRLNPRVTETNVYDDANNRRRTRMSHTSFGLVSDVYEYDANATTVLRHARTDYNLSAVYTSRRIIGLPSAQFLYDGANNLFSKVTYEYDLNPNPNPYLQHPGLTAQHDTTNYGTGFVQGRGNLNRKLSWDVTDPNSASKASEYETGYNTSGSVIFTRDPLDHQSSISYADSFSDGQNRNTYAYPTTMTDPDTFSSTVQYNYDFGAVTRTEDPKDAAVTRTYDAAGRIERITNMVNGAYTRYFYEPKQSYVQSFTTINDLNPANEHYVAVHLDGHDRVRATSSVHPTSAGQHKAQLNVYDVMGRLVEQTNPTEINGSWQPTGDDAAGWAWSYQDYDSQGRPTVTTNQDGTTKSISYEGCGCAGGQKVVLTDELGRRREQNFDILGRMWRERTYNWGGSNETGIYTTTTSTYNVRDQVTNINVLNNASSVSQNTVMTYDGHGRLKEKWLPIFMGNPQSATPYLSYEYYDDDTLKKVTDPRGATATQVYNNRHLVTGVTYGAPSGVAAAPNVTFAYDEAGNRTLMDDGPGLVTYNYDTLSRLINETRVFDNISRYHYQGSGQPYQNTFSIGYEYNLAGGLKQIQTPTGDTVDYSFDKAGMVTRVSGTPRDGVTDYITNIQYRAWGAAKRVSFGYANYSIDAQFNGRMLISRVDDQSQFGVTYNYNADGRVNTVQGVYARTLDRSFSYDHIGRVTQTRSGSAAGLGGTEPEQLKQDYVHNAFDHMTARSGRYWYTSQSSDSVFSASYVNDRATNVTDKGIAQNWQYDVAGNIKNFLNNSTGWIESNDWDAASRPAKRSWIGPIGGEVGFWTDFEYDGNGNLVSETPTSPPGVNKPFTDGTASYYVTSSVLSKKLLSVSISWVLINGQYVIRQEQLLNGQLRDLTEKKLSVYAGGEEVATRIYEAYVFQNSNRVIWQHRDPHGAIAKIGNVADSSTYSVDPLGVLVKTATQSEIDAYWNPPGGGDPTPPEGFYSDQSGQNSSYGFSSPSPGNWGLGCYVDGIQVSCERAFRASSNGSGYINNFNITGGMGGRGPQ